MPPLSLLIKPASSSCNLECAYCFYHSLSETRRIRSYGMMDSETLELLVRKALGYADGICTFAFQGGEPVLAGLEFYRRLVGFEKRYNVKGIQINNAIQTNGILIDSEWAGFLAENRFLTGISLDGPKDIHDALRTGQGGKGSYNRVMEAVALMDKYKAEYNILSVVTTFTARHVGKIYNFYKKYGFKYLQFIPCLDPLGEKPGGHVYSLAAGRYAYFLKTLFDSWYADIMNGEMISIRYFENLVGMAMGRRPEECGMSGGCSCQFVVEADGSVFPCDFYVTDEWLLGNLKEDSFEGILNSAGAKEFIGASMHPVPECIECKWYSLCRGGCRRYREDPLAPFSEVPRLQHAGQTAKQHILQTAQQHDEQPAWQLAEQPVQQPLPGLNIFCRAYREFFDYAGDRIFELARLFAR